MHEIKCMKGSSTLHAFPRVCYVENYLRRSLIIYHFSRHVNIQWNFLFFLLVSTYVVCERLSVMQMLPASGMARQNLCSNWQEHPVLGQNTPPPQK